MDDEPDSSALLRGLAEEESNLPEGSGEGVFGRHGLGAGLKSCADGSEDSRSIV